MVSIQGLSYYTTALFPTWGTLRIESGRWPVITGEKFSPHHSTSVSTIGSKH